MTAPSPAVIPGLQRLAQNLPRYTSYPPANHFRAEDAKPALAALLEAAREAPSLSLYAHIPFCDKLCWFCGCHTKHTLSYEPIAAYIEKLVAEIALLARQIDTRRKLSRLHLGGGSPSLLQSRELDILRSALETYFDFASDTEISIEIDPSDVKPGSLALFRAFGLNRASIGVQDFDPVVQAAINRPQSFELTRQVVDELRATGIDSLNIDALYGLPHQSKDRLLDTVHKLISLNPDRIALFGYAHVPWMKSHQRLIPEDALPGSEERLTHANLARSLILEAGYEPIGIDHFAKPGDGLARAAAEGRLHRNFQGYTDDQATVLLGLGTSSISRYPGGYCQNTAATGRYTTAISAGQNAVERGLVLTRQDRVNAWIIEQMMCHFSFDKAQLLDMWGPETEPRWQVAEQLATGELDDLCHLDGGRFAMIPGKELLVRVVASRFDDWLGQARIAYSKAV